MQVSRRGFIAGLGALAAAVVAAPVLESAAAPGSPSVSTSAGELFKVGDVITIKGRYAVHPVTGRVLPHEQRFVVTAQATAGELAARVDPPIYPRMVDAGPYRNVSSAAPFKASDVVEVCWPTPPPQGLQFHPNAFAVVIR